MPGHYWKTLSNGIVHDPGVASNTRIHGPGMLATENAGRELTKGCVEPDRYCCHNADLERRREGEGLRLKESQSVSNEGSEAEEGEVLFE